MTRKEWPIMWVCVSSPLRGISRQSRVRIEVGRRAFVWACAPMRGDAFKIEEVEKYGAETPRWIFPVITHHCSMYANYIWKGCVFFFCLLALSQNLRANMSASMVWSHGLRFHKVMHVGFGMNSVYPGLLGSMGTCQRSAGSLGIRLLILADLSGAQIFHDFSFSQV